jgi:hypothetical protein
METTSDPTGTLTDEELELLFRCERAIKAWKESFYLAGSALRTVRDRRLYRGTHAAFGTYVWDEFNLSRSRAAQLIDAVGVVDNLRDRLSRGMSTMVDILPSNERQIRPLLKLSMRVGRRRVLDFEKIGKAWLEVLASAPVGSDGAPRITGEFVRHVVERIRQADATPGDQEQRIRRRKRALKSAFSTAASDSRNDPPARKIMAEYARTLLLEFEESHDERRDGAEALSLTAR